MTGMTGPTGAGPSGSDRRPIRIGAGIGQKPLKSSGFSTGNYRVFGQFLTPDRVFDQVSGPGQGWRLVPAPVLAGPPSSPNQPSPKLPGRAGEFSRQTPTGGPASRNACRWPAGQCRWARCFSFSLWGRAATQPWQAMSPRSLSRNSQSMKGSINGRATSDMARRRACTQH